MPPATIAILDFGAQYVQLIARRVREEHVHSIIVEPDVSVDRLRKLNTVGLILSGGPSSVYAEGAPRCRPEIFDASTAEREQFLGLRPPGGSMIVWITRSDVKHRWRQPWRG